MKKFLLPFLSVFVLGIAVSCSNNDDPTPTPPTEPGEEIVKSGILTENETWTANNIYVLDGRVVVNEGVTLTIEPGTIIKAEGGQGANASALIVDRGGRLLADGTAENPIIFTSVDDGIAVGEKASTLPVENAGLWGGVILLGNAPISVANAEGVAYIEGIPAGLSYGEYGGTNAADDSGVLRYVSIRYSGVALENDSEIQGLTLGGVGSGTTIENIEIFSNNDDGIEWFGGTVNVTNVLVYGQQDDGLDIDQAYSGTINNAYVLMTQNSGSGLEIDGPEGNPTGLFTMQNVTIDMGNFENKLIADFRSRAMGHLENIFVTNINATGATVNINDVESATNLNADQLTFTNWVLNAPEGVTIANLFTAANNAAPDASKFINNATIGTEGGADLSAFGWTYTSSLGVGAL